ncbi:hypothetical protein H4R19_001156 [Coemansia spiralis]|nr:hypothetical protein H4R19_001156 [Coemansia spiralis]
MGQYWNMFCIDNRQMTGHMGKLAEAFYSEPHYVEYELLRGRVANHSFLTSLPAPPPRAPLELLPSLIKRRICAFLATIDIDGLLCVIMAVPHMAADGQVALNSATTWAGKRFINLGDYAVDLPQNLLTKDEEPLRLDRGEDTWILDKSKFVDISSEWRNSCSRAMDYIQASQESTRPLPDNIINDLLAPRIERPDNTVLRNLTLKQYYRGGDCYTLDHCNCGISKASKNSDVDDGDDVEFGLGQVLLIMTCWSNDPSTSFHADWTRDDVHGEWAGHRLDIVAAEAVNSDWKDVTVAVKEKLMRLRDQD